MTTQAKILNAARGSTSNRTEKLELFQHTMRKDLQMIRSFLKVLFSFLFELFGKNLTYDKLDKQLQKSQIALTNWSTDGSQNSDRALREYLYKQRKSLLRIKIWLLEQHQEVTGITYVTATDLHGEKLKAACLEHHVEAFELLKLMRQNMPNIPTQKLHVGAYVLSGQAFLAFQFNQFVFSSDRPTRNP